MLLSSKFYANELFQIWGKNFETEEKVSTEPDSNQRPKDFMVDVTLQSSALPTELSVGYRNVISRSVKFDASSE